MSNAVEFLSEYDLNYQLVYSSTCQLVNLLNINYQSFVCEYGIREDVFSLIEKDILVIIACTEMTKDKSFDVGIPCHLRRLCCRAVIIDAGTLNRRGIVCALMIENINIGEHGVELRHIAGVAAISVAACRVCWRGETFVGNLLAFIGRPSGSCTDIVQLREGYAIEINHVSTNMPVALFLTEDITATGYTMVQR